MKSVAVLLLALAACGRLDFVSAPDAETADAAISIGCTMPTTLYDTFDVGPPCSAWGFVDTASATVTLANGQLLVTSDPDVGSTRGGCGANDPFAFDPDIGLFAQVTMLGDTSEYVEVHAQYAGAVYRDALSWSASNGNKLEFIRETIATMAMTFYGTVDFDPVATGWARMRPSADRTTTIAEYSADGMTWHQFGVDPNPPSANIHAEIYAGTFEADANPSVVAFDSLNVCP